MPSEEAICSTTRWRAERGGGDAPACSAGRSRRVSLTCLKWRSRAPRNAQDAAPERRIPRSSEQPMSGRLERSPVRGHSV